MADMLKLETNFADVNFSVLDQSVDLKNGIYYTSLQDFLCILESNKYCVLLNLSLALNNFLNI